MKQKVSLRSIHTSQLSIEIIALLPKYYPYKASWPDDVCAVLKPTWAYGTKTLIGVMPNAIQCNFEAMQTIALLTLLVRDYEEAIAFYVGLLGFEKMEDTPQGNGKRRVVVAPAGSRCGLVLAKATTDDQVSRIGRQCGDRVFLYLHTDDIVRDFEQLRNKGVVIVREPVTADFGMALVFEDLYGNKWDLVQPA